MYKITSRWLHQDTVKIEWNLSKRCNYDCSYCPSAIHDNHSPHTDIEVLKRAVDTLMAVGKPIRLSFTGGEPCVHPKFSELVEHCRKVGIAWISVTTNGTLPFNFYANLPVDQLVVSIHFEYDWQRVFNTVEKLADLSNTSILVQIMAHHDHMNSVKEVRARCLSANISNTVRRIRWTEGDHNTFDDLRYRSDDLQWILNSAATVEPNCLIDDGQQLMHANDIIKLHLNQFKGWKCSAGRESLMINWDGEVYRATCRVGDTLGNIYNDTFYHVTTDISCTRDWCTCAADIPLTKTKE